MLVEYSRSVLDVVDSLSCEVEGVCVEGICVFLITRRVAFEVRLSACVCCCTCGRRALFVFPDWVSGVPVLAFILRVGLRSSMKIKCSRLLYVK